MPPARRAILPTYRHLGALIPVRSGILRGSGFDARDGKQCGDAGIGGNIANPAPSINIIKRLSAECLLRFGNAGLYQSPISFIAKIRIVSTCGDRMVIKKFIGGALC
jgi:hypothetical protein